MKKQAVKAAASDVRIVLINQQELFRAGIRSLLQSREGFKVVGEAAGESDGIEIVKREQPDVTLLGTDVNEGKGLELLPRIFAAAEATRVLILSDSADPDLQRQAIRLGAIGVVSKNKSADVLIKAIERVHAGEAWVDRSTIATVLGDFSPVNRTRKQDPTEAKIASISAREREVIRLVGEGLNARQIGERLFISEVTVHHHLTSIYSKLEVAGRLELLIFAYRNGLAEIPR
jgi:two-component system nitrate/nitrite response regulator NarL